MHILLVDDHALFREGLCLLLSDLSADMECAHAGSCDEALDHVRRQAFDIVMLDYHLPGRHGLEALTAIHEASNAPRIVVLSAEEDPDLIRSVIDAGASGFIPKASSHAVMMAALKLIIAGGTYLPPHAAYASPGVLPELDDLSEDATGHLTERQLHTLRLAVQGKGNKQIAREMDISESTVKAHLSAAFRALGARNRTEAVYVAARAGIKL